jgi:tripartite-type tricarboxylate transporter receptor subunit TctC
MGLDITAGAMRIIAGPANLPAAVKAAVEPALKKVFDSKEYQEFMNARGFGLVYADGAGAGQALATADASLGDAMKAAGLAKT